MTKKKSQQANDPTADQHFAQFNAALEAALNSDEMQQVLNKLMSDMPSRRTLPISKPRRKQRRAAGSKKQP